MTITHVYPMQIEMFLAVSAAAFLLKVAIYTAAACFVARYAAKQLK
jgi:hypothetical protein